jgi:hypothetical protein
MAIALREKKVGPYVVRELPMRETMRVLAAYPEGGSERSAAMLGAAVSNGSDAPVGMAVLDFGTGLYTQLMEAYSEVSGKVMFDEDERGNV